MTSIRTFIAIPTSPDVQQRMAEIQAKLKATETEVKWDTPEKFHITLKFLGNIEPSKIEPLAEALTKVVNPFSQFEILYDTLGAFPNLHNPRVVWIGAKPLQIMLDLQSAIEQVCSNFGFPRENRAFHPHITFGRVKGIRNLGRLTEVIKNITFEPIQSNCSGVHLMKSDLNRRGSTYTILKVFSLQSCNTG